jgi:hypothetical protein
VDKQQFMRNFINKFIVILFFCSLVSLFTFARFDYPLTGIDDANIYLVYARNVANGHGFVYNIGGENVEGFTSLLWTLVCALAFKLSPHPELLLLIINIVILSLGITVAVMYVQNGFLGEEKSQRIKLIYAIIFGILLLTSPRYIVWNTITLMENSLWSTLLLITTVFTIESQPASRSAVFGFTALLILLITTRPESILWVMIFAAIYFMRLAFLGNITRALKTLAPSSVCIAVALIMLTLFRLRYFGYPLPNTYYAKVSPSLAYNLQEGTLYLVRYFLSDALAFISVTAVLAGGLAIIFRIRSRQISKDNFFILPIVAGAGLFIPLLTGGDHFGSFRFYQNIYPILLLTLLYLVSRIQSEQVKVRWSPPATPWQSMTFRIILILIAVFGLFLNQAYAWSRFESEINTEFNVARYERKNGAFIQGLFSELPVLPDIGVIASGGIKYSYEGEIIDLMGLNNTVMAHSDGDRTGHKNHAAFTVATFYELQPDIVWPKLVNQSKWQYAEITLKEGWENKQGFKGLFDEPHFLELYTYAQVSSKPENKYALVAWFKKDFLKQLEATPDFHVVEYQYIP